MKVTTQIDPEMTEFEKDLLTSVDQMLRGEYGRVHTPEQIQARKRGRPVGHVKANPKIPTTIRFSPDVIEAFKATGKGWQTRMDLALREWLQTHSPADLDAPSESA